MANDSIKTGLEFLSKLLIAVMSSALLLSGCDNGSNAEDTNAYVTMSIPTSAASGGGVTTQALDQYSSIIITVRDDHGFSTSGDIKKTGGNLTLSVKPYTALTVSGLAYVGGVATLEGTQRVKALRPGEVANVNFALNPISPPAKPAPLVTPANGEVGVPLDTQFIANMSFLSGDIATIDNASLTLAPIEGAAITTNYVAPDGGLTLSFTLPSGQGLALSTEYGATLQVDYTDNTGTAKTFNYLWSFSTSVFPDIDLASCVHNTMQANGQQNYTDVTDLDCSGDNYYYSVADLSGMQVLTNLKTFDVSMYCDCNGSFITDLSPLSGLHSLESLDLGYNLNTADITPLSGLTNLQNLVLSDNQIADASPIYGLSKLKTLDLSYNQISDASFLNAMPNLESIDLSYNQISDAGFLNTMSNLTSVNLSYNQISTVSLQGMANLLSMDMTYNGITRFSINGSMPKLNNMNLGFNFITELVLTGDYPGLQTLNLSSNNIKDVTGLQKLTTLQYLYLSTNNVEDVTPLSSLVSLVSLDLSSDDLNTGVASLNTLTSATNINLQYNQTLPCADADALDASLDSGNIGGGAGIVRWNVCFLDPLISSLSFDPGLKNCIDQTVQASQPAITNVSQLTDLSCPSAGITALTGIEQLKKLKTLDLSGNTGITNYGGLSGLPDLTTLNLSNANFNDVYSISYLKNLQILYLDSNPFTYVGNATIYSNYLGRLTNLTTLSLSNNNISNTLQGLGSLYKAQTIDLTCSPPALESEIIALDGVLDNTPAGQDGSTTGVVRWTLCPAL